jgi:glycosyltransferase involved in cell wall biosynthesis
LPEVAGDAGFIVDVHQPTQVAHTVMQLAADEQLRQEYIRRGLARAAQFTWDACVARLVEAMRQRQDA